MSLLHDALKKREQEIQDPDISSHLLGLQGNERIKETQPKKLFLTLLAILVLFSAGLSYGIFKYSTSQIRPKVMSIQSSKKNSDKTGPHTYALKNETSESEGTKVSIQATKRVTVENNIIPKNEDATKKETKVKEKQEKSVVKNNRDNYRVVISKKDHKSRETNRPRTKHLTTKPEEREKPVSVTRAEHQNSIEAFFVTAARYQRDGRISEAIRIYKEILTKYPRNRKARLNLGAAYLQRGQFSAALNIMEKLYKEYPNDPRVLLDYAIVLTKFGKLKQALNFISLAAAKRGPRYEILLNKGIVLRKLGRIREAIIAYQEASHLKPQEPSLQYNIAIMYDAARAYQKAIKYYKIFLENPKHDNMKDKAVRQRLQQLYAYLNHFKHAELSRN